MNCGEFDLTVVNVQIGRYAQHVEIIMRSGSAVGHSSGPGSGRLEGSIDKDLTRFLAGILPPSVRGQSVVTLAKAITEPLNSASFI